MNMWQWQLPVQEDLAYLFGVVVIIGLLTGLYIRLRLVRPTGRAASTASPENNQIHSWTSECDVDHRLPRGDSGYWNMREMDGIIRSMYPNASDDEINLRLQSLVFMRTSRSHQQNQQQQPYDPGYSRVDIYSRRRPASPISTATHSEEIW